MLVWWWIWWPNRLWLRGNIIILAISNIGRISPIRIIVNIRDMWGTWGVIVDKGDHVL